jgi:hypothetical protein
MGKACCAISSFGQLQKQQEQQQQHHHQQQQQQWRLQQHRVLLHLLHLHQLQRQILQGVLHPQALLLQC